MKKKIIILSLAFNYHDSNIALSIDDKIVASLELERLFRSKKINASLTQMEIGAKYLLDRYNLSVSDIDYLVVNALNNPFDDKLSLDDIRKSKYKFLGRKMNVFIVRHHMAHAGYYYFSNFKKALIASCDGGGDMEERVVYFLGKNNNIERLNIDTAKHISTKPYGQFSFYLYQEPFSEGKLMGLSGLSKKGSERFSAKIKKVFSLLKNTNFIAGQAILNKYFKKEKGLASKNPESCAFLAFCIQKEFVKRRLNDLKKVFKKDYENLVLVGGSALNLECNSNVYKNITSGLYIPPNCDDTGIAVGQCAIIVAKLLNKKPQCNLPFIGVEENRYDYSLIKNRKRKDIIIENNPKIIAKRLAKNEICIRHYGRPEVGPRALGHRSFLMSPLNKKNKDIISVDVKKREWYRPVAPIIIEEDLCKYFGKGPQKSQYMLFSYDTTKEAIKKIPAVIHYDGTSRVQTVNKKEDPFMYKILTEFKKITGVGVLINTSLNLKGQPLLNFLHDTFEITRKIHIKKFITLK